MGCRERQLEASRLTREALHRADSLPPRSASALDDRISSWAVSSLTPSDAFPRGQKSSRALTVEPAEPGSSLGDAYQTPDSVSYRREEKHQRPGRPSRSVRARDLLQVEPPAPVHGMFALPDEDAAEAAAASATNRMSAIQLGAVQAYVNTSGLNKLRELDPLPAFDGTPAGWDQSAQDWHDVKDLHILGVPPAMHPRVLMRCLPTGLRRSVAGWVHDDPAMSLDQVFDRLRQDFQIADA